MFGIEPVPAEVRPSVRLESISEEGEAVCTPQPVWPGRASIVGLGLFFLLALEAESPLPCMKELPIGEVEHPCIRRHLMMTPSHLLKYSIAEQQPQQVAMVQSGAQEPCICGSGYFNNSLKEKG